MHWRSEATTSGGGGGVFICKFQILPTNSILLVKLPTIFNKFTDRTRSFNRFFCYILVLPTNLPRLGGVAPPTPPATYALVGVIDVIGVMIVVCILNAGLARTLIGGGGGCIFIYAGSVRLISFEINFISKEKSRTEPEYMNYTPPSISVLATALIKRSWCSEHY